MCSVLDSERGCRSGGGVRIFASHSHTILNLRRGRRASPDCSPSPSPFSSAASPHPSELARTRPSWGGGLTWLMLLYKRRDYRATRRRADEKGEKAGVSIHLGRYLVYTPVVQPVWWQGVQSRVRAHREGAQGAGHCQPNGSSISVGCFFWVLLDPSPWWRRAPRVVHYDGG